MLRLYTLPPAFEMRNVSPFCLKAEMLMTALDLRFEHVTVEDPRKAPKGKLPWLDDDGTVVADSELIVLHLDAKTEGAVYAGLDARQKAEGVAWARLAEEHLYWIMVASRWLDDGWFPNVVSGFFGFVPAPLRGIVAGFARRDVARTYRLQGLGLHTRSEQEGFARRDLAALDARVAATAPAFLFSDTPCVYDFTIASIVAGILDNEPATWLTPIAREYTALADYTDRVQEAVGVRGRVR